MQPMQLIEWSAAIAVAFLAACAIPFLSVCLAHFLQGKKT